MSPRGDDARLRAAVPQLHGSVVLEDGATLTEKGIQVACQGRLESFMVPKQVVILSDLPKTTSGKIAKRNLR